MPAYAHDFPFVVAREVDGEFWFWGAYESFESADTVADEVGGWVVAL